MKNSIFISLFSFLVLLMAGNRSSAQWQHCGAGIPQDGDMPTCLLGKGQYLFFGTWNGDVFRSENGGETWEILNIDGGGFMWDMIEYNNKIWVTSPNGIYMSPDNGDTWQPMNNGLSDISVRALAVAGNVIFCGNNDGVYRSPDQGASWALANTGLPGEPFLGYRVEELAAHGDALFMCSEVLGHWLSTDLGQSWTNVDFMPMTPNDEIYQFASNGTEIIGAIYTHNRGAIRSKDAGATWERINDGLDDAVRMFSIVAEGTTFYAGAESKVFVTTNSGDKWYDVSSGLAASLPWPIYDMCLVGDTLYAAQYKAGIYKAATKDLTAGIGALPTFKDSPSVLYQNKPNPFTSRTEIKYTLNKPGSVILTIHDLFGNEIARLVDTDQIPGDYRITFDTGTLAGNISNGMYFYSLKAGSSVQTKKMCLMR